MQRCDVKFVNLKPASDLDLHSQLVDRHITVYKRTM